MSDKISDLLAEDFGFQGFLGGPEYDNFPSWKKAAADALLEKGMSYRIAKINLNTACVQTQHYVNHVKKFGLLERKTIPVWSKPGDISGLLLLFQMITSQLKDLIRIYNSGD